MNKWFMFFTIVRCNIVVFLNYVHKPIASKDFEPVIVGTFQENDEYSEQK